MILLLCVAVECASLTRTVPDFRSSAGLFNSLRSEHNLKGGSGKDLFDASVVYKDASSTSSFHDMIRGMSKLTKAAKPTPFHNMLATLSQQDRLLRLYSQNVDGIETALEPLATRTPLGKDESGKWPKTVQLHGGLDKMVCSKCPEMETFQPDLFAGPVPPICSNCVEVNRIRTEEFGKRSHGIGMLRPRMVLYNEHNPDDEAIGSVTRDDLRKRPDAIIVVGTTLKVPGVKRIVREMCATVRDRKDGVAIWINNDPEPSGKEFEDCWDIIVRAKCDDVARLAALGPWDNQDDSREVTLQSVERASKGDCRVVLGDYNPTFKRPRADETPCTSPTRPPMSPMSVPPHVLDSFDDASAVDLEAAVETPSRRKSKAPIKPAAAKTSKRAPAKATTKASQKNLGQMLADTKKAPSTAPKRSNVKHVKKNPKAETAKKSAANLPKRTQASINQTFKATKAVSVAGKVEKNGKPMKPIAPEDSRNNSYSSPSGPTIGDSEDERKLIAKQLGQDSPIVAA